MERTLRFFWPRAASKLYEAPKLLASLGLARATRESVGRRPRTRYQISPRGEEALQRWLGTRTIAPIELESEALLRVWFQRADISLPVGLQRDARGVGHVGSARAERLGRRRAYG